MKGQIDIISFCKILTDLTNKDKCNWNQTSQISRDRLDLKSGYIDITLFEDIDKKYYCIDVFNSNGMQCIPYIAIKGVDIEGYKVYGDLYKSIWEYYERVRNRQLSKLYVELMEITSK